MAKLYLLGKDGAMAEQWEIGSAPVAVGRGTSVDVKINDDGLSRRHFLIVQQGEEYVIKDLSSRNGTWVHGHRAVIAKLHDNDCILAGRSLFRFCEHHAAPALPSMTGPHGTKILSAALDSPLAVAQAD